MLWEEIEPRHHHQNCSATSVIGLFDALLLSPAAVKAVARFVYGLGQLYDSFCLSAASERLYQLQASGTWSLPAAVSGSSWCSAGT